MVENWNFFDDKQNQPIDKVRFSSGFFFGANNKKKFEQKVERQIKKKQNRSTTIPPIQKRLKNFRAAWLTSWGAGNGDAWRWWWKGREAESKLFGAIWLAVYSVSLKYAMKAGTVYFENIYFLLTWKRYEILRVPWKSERKVVFKAVSKNATELKHKQKPPRTYSA